MNNKYLKYFLLFAVIGVWATIIYRVVHGLGGPGAPDPVRVISERKIFKREIDTFNLYADYPDPFLSASDTTAEDTVSAKNNTLPPGIGTSAIQPPTEEIVAGIIQFNGMISNTQKKSRVAIITVRGKEYLVRENDKLENIRIRKIDKTKLLIIYKGTPYTLHK